MRNYYCTLTSASKTNRSQPVECWFGCWLGLLELDLYILYTLKFDLFGFKVWPYEAKVPYLAEVHEFATQEMNFR